MNKAFIFDWSGTLMNNFDVHCEVCDLMFKELGHESISPTEIRRNMTSPYMKFWNKYFPDLTLERQDELYSKYMQQVSPPNIFENVDQVVKALHERGYKLFVVSSDPLTSLAPQVEASNLSPYLEEVIGKDYLKSDTAKKLVDKFLLDNERSFFVGDCSGDIEAGKAAGIKTVGLAWGFEDKNRLAQTNPDYLIDDILEIERIISE
ncbi:MAG: HAD family hydrolase [Patescibacteria group bacterium]|nr:HAD family hydrolase [Patescibacteria group bacterium]